MASLRTRVAAVGAIVALLSLAALVWAGSSPSASAAGEREQFLSLLNEFRVSQGLSTLQPDPELDGLAQEWAEHVAVVKQMVHPPDPRVGVSSPWVRLGENVAYGSTTMITWQGLLDSPSHRRNMSDPGFTHVGIGVAYDEAGVQYISQRFMEIGPATAPEPEPEPEPVAAPEPVVEPPVAAPVEVLGAAITPVDVNLAVIPPIRYGGTAATPMSTETDDGLPVLAIAAVIAALLLAGSALWVVRARRT